ncbi:MAG: hypothetical protein K8R25_13525 [Methanosarcinales archaeon]|nr:hypothetical protein [Methanosarcinales archaeon]
MVNNISSYSDAVAQSIIVDKEIKEYINKHDRDFRICTSCRGPVLMPIDIIPSKPGDIKVKIGDNTLFMSLFQAEFTRRIHKSLLTDYTDYNAVCGIETG